MIQRRFLPKELHDVSWFARSDGDESQLDGIRGTSVVFFDESNVEDTQYRLWGRTYERLMPGCLEESMSRPDDVRGLQNHDPRLLLGRNVARTMRLTVDDVGQHYEIDTPDTTAGRDTLVSLKRGDMTGSSFSFSMDAAGARSAWIEETLEDESTIYIRQIDMIGMQYDASPVTFPAYTGTDSGIRCRAGILSMESRGDGEVEQLKSELHEFLQVNYYAPEARRRARQLQLLKLGS